MNRDDSIASNIPITSPQYEMRAFAIQRNATVVRGAKMKKMPRSRNPNGFHRSRIMPKANPKYAGMAVNNRKVETSVAVACNWFFSMYEVWMSIR